MSRQNIGIGTVANDGTGDPLRTAFDKTNDNFIELYLQSGHASYADNIYVDSGTAFTLTANTDTVLPINGGTLYTSQKPSDITEFYFSGGLDISSVTGTFVVDEVITGGTSGTTATIRELGSGTIEFLGNSGSFTATETITGGTSGATATVDTLRNGYITGREDDNLDIMIYFKAVPSNVSQWLDVWIDIGGAVGELYRETFSFPKGSGVARGVLYSLSAAYTRNTFEANGGTIYIRSDASLDIYGINANFDRSYKAR